MLRHSLLLFLLLPLLVASIVNAAGEHNVSLTLRVKVGADGWGSGTLSFDHGITLMGYHVIGSKSPVGILLPSHPLMYATLPDPLLWSKLQKVALLPPLTSRMDVAVDIIAGKPSIIVAVPGRPGSVAEVKLTLTLRDGDPRSNKSAPDMVIIIPGNSTVMEYASRIASIHEKAQGLKVKIVTVDEVARRYAPTDTRQTIRRMGLCSGDKVAKEYNLSLALSILSYVRHLAESGVKYLLLVGGAREVPPLYYCSPLLSELVYEREGVIATDYYYSDPDGDGVAEIAVGRIPFSDPGKLSSYIEALEKWVEGGSWQKRALVAGGAPFATVFLSGEEAAARVSRSLADLGLMVDSLMLTQGNYIGTRLNGYIGRYGLYFIMAHGTGSSLLDYIPGGYWNYDFEEKLHSSDIGYAANPAVYLLPACRDGFWDTDLVKTPFKPPSLAQTLVSKGAAIAYIGFSRIAVEIIDAVSLVDGRLSLSLAGADGLLAKFIDSLASSDTLGEAWAKAVSSYLRLPSSRYRAYMTTGEEVIGELVAREAVFLGDPAAPNPWKKPGKSEGESVPTLRVKGGVSLGASILAEKLARYSHGNLYAVKPVNNTVTVEFPGACPDAVNAVALRRAEGIDFLDVVSLSTETRHENDTCWILVKTPPGNPSLTVLTTVWGDKIAHFYLLAAGAAYNPSDDALELHGLDSLGLVGIEPLRVVIGNRTLDIIPGGLPAASIPLKGAHGEVRVEPLYHYESLLGGPIVEKEYSKLLKLFTLIVNSTEPTKYSVLMGQEQPFNPLQAKTREGCGENQDTLTVKAAATTLTAAVTAWLIIRQRSRRETGQQLQNTYL
ncbi:MAG: hypothetical protein DSY37_04040 [Hyperthermus sp.]|nr:MAG: hypothetical protein DSY37_04040 [Hyperthermus sp.]